MEKKLVPVRYAIKGLPVEIIKNKKSISVVKNSDGKNSEVFTSDLEIAPRCQHEGKREPKTCNCRDLNVDFCTSYLCDNYLSQNKVLHFTL